MQFRFRHVVPAAILLAAAVGCSSTGTEDASTTPEPEYSPLVEAPETVIIAHRGSPQEAPENTVPAFEAAVEAGADLVEVDVQLSADGVPFLFHDETPERTTDVAEVFPDRVEDPITSFTWEELQQLDAGAWFSAAFEGTAIPGLDEVAETVGPDVGVDIEMKSPETSPGLAEAVAEALGTEAWSDLVDNDLVVVSSFDTDAARTFHEALPEVPAWPIIGEIPDQAWVDGVTDYAAGIKADHRYLTPETYAYAEAADLPVWAWTVNNLNDLPDLVEMGVTAVITDDPWYVGRALGR
ncbi:MAG TPA: hypothetical protein H9815_03680 [Candidatus Ruania gallistercoris]|uniref:GP-PDE domain-containing protein n=1 Tax=Candidatus Ruania gallistercoris TaxID=2838746 RepID=A0A9D2ECX1_9MICO|nr:hypothetical protein [Candidatus Ruania gallistercoris]